MQLCVLNLDYFVFQFGINCKMIYYLCNIITTKLKKLFRIFLFFMMIACETKLKASNCIPAGTTVTLTRQSEVDSFPINYPGCDVVEGDLVISGDDIVNLNGLIGLKRVLNYLRIINNPLLINLSGLNNIIFVNDLEINTNNALTSLNGLNKLDTTWYFDIINNDKLINFLGLDNLKTIGYFEVSYNELLQNFAGLKSLKTTGTRFTVSENNSLIDFIGLDSIKFIWSLGVYRNPMLKNFAGFISLKYLDNFTIDGNNSLKNFVGLDNINQLHQHCFIWNNNSLINFYGLQNVDKFNSTLDITNNSSIQNFTGLNRVKYIGSLTLFSNSSLENFIGLNNLDTISYIFQVNNNSALKNFDGLQNFKNMGYAFFDISQNISLCSINQLNNIIFLDDPNVYIKDNPKLSCCKIMDTILRNNPTLSGIYISNNAPGCNDTTEIRTITTQNCCSTKYTLLKDTICNGEQVIFNSQILKNTGTYYDTFVSNGNDSIVILELKVFNKSYQIKTLNFCIGQSFTLSNGRTITATGIYKDTIPNFCDSIIEYRLIFLNNIIVNQNATICQGKTYTLPKGNIVQTTGIYKDTLRSAFTCDSIVITNLTVTKPIPFVNNATICKGKNYVLPNGNSVNNAGTYYDTIRKPNTCDSIVITNLTVTKPIPFVNNATICKGKNYVLPNGNSVNNTGTYYDTIRKPNTCDSIVITNLTVNPYLQSSQTATTCLGKTYTLPSGKTVTQSGIYKDTIQTTFGCDSIVTTNLSITNPTPTQISDSICEGKIYTLPSGKQVTNTGVYVDTIKITNTCDSVIITNLSVFQNNFSVSLKSVDTLDAGNAIELKPMYSNQPAISWNWSPTTNLNCTTCEKPIATPSQNTQYSLKATAQNGCDDTAKTTIIVRQTEVYIPTAFSPNNDGINDDLTVFVNNPVAFHLVIFNRYDQKVFESVDVLNKWNGTYKNAECEVDNYVYVLDVTTANGKQHHKQGTITLLR